MKKILLLISLSIVLAAFVTPAYSSDHKEKHSYNGHLGDMDMDGDDELNWKEFINDGQSVKTGDTIAEFSGTYRALLSGSITFCRCRKQIDTTPEPHWYD